jgi:hypothetical protein
MVSDARIWRLSPPTTARSTRKVRGAAAGAAVLSFRRRSTHHRDNNLHANRDFDSDTIPRDRRTELEAAIVAAGRPLRRLFEDISVPFDWSVTAAEFTERVRATMDD